MNRLRGLTVVALASLLGFVATLPSYGSGLRCKSDPVVLLSDGTEVDVSADIGTPLWNVSAVNYTLRVPSGVQVVLVLSTPNWPKTVERFRILTDNPAGQYSSVTSVQTTKTNVDVTANLVAGGAFASVSGKSGQSLRLQVTASALLPL